MQVPDGTQTIYFDRIPVTLRIKCQPTKRTFTSQSFEARSRFPGCTVRAKLITNGTGTVDEFTGGSIYRRAQLTNWSSLYPLSSSIDKRQTLWFQGTDHGANCTMRPAVGPSCWLFVEWSADPIDNPARPHWPLSTVHTTQAQNQTETQHKLRIKLKTSTSPVLSLLTKQTLSNLN